MVVAVFFLLVVLIFRLFGFLGLVFAVQVTHHGSEFVVHQLVLVAAGVGNSPCISGCTVRSILVEAEPAIFGKMADVSTFRAHERVHIIDLLLVRTIVPGMALLTAKTADVFRFLSQGSVQNGKLL